MQDKTRQGAARRRAAAGLLALLTLAGCAAGNGAAFLAQEQKAGGPKSGLARVYIYPAGRPPNVSVALDGQLLGELTAGTYLMRDIPAGGHELVSETPTYPGVTHFRFSAAAGKIYYFAAEPSEAQKSMQTGATWAYIFGTIPMAATSMVMGAANAGKGGPVNFVTAPESLAAQNLSTLSPR